MQSRFTNLVLALPHARARRLKALGISGPKRGALAPEVPTIAEQGYAGFEVTSWYGLFLPGKTNGNIVQTLNAEARKALTAPDVLEAMTRQGVEAAYLAREPFTEQARRETATWAQVVREAGILVE